MQIRNIHVHTKTAHNFVVNGRISLLVRCYVTRRQTKITEQ